MDTIDLIDALADLQHDLGKTLMVSMVWLPADASPEAVREAADTALNRTRRGPQGVRTAAELYAEFLAEAGQAVAAFRRWPETDLALARALAHRAAVADPQVPLDRAVIHADFVAAYMRLCDLIAEVNLDDF